MSQAKVDRNKEQKKNIKKTLKARRRNHIISIICGVVIAAAIVGFVSFSGYKKYQAYKAENITSTEVDLDELTGYMSGIGADSSEAQE